MATRREPSVCTSAIDAWMIEELRRREREEQDGDGMRPRIEMPGVRAPIEPDDTPERSTAGSVVVIEL